MILSSNLVFLSMIPVVAGTGKNMSLAKTVHQSHLILRQSDAIYFLRILLLNIPLSRKIFVIQNVFFLYLVRKYLN